jgi:CBS domain-containing protein
MISKFMSRNIVTGKPNETIQQVAKRMKEKKVGMIIILDKGKLTGVISERDIINRVVSVDLPNVTKVKRIMTKRVITGNPDMSIEKIASLFQKNGIKKLPIVKKQKVVGVITQTDLLKILSLKWAL